MDSNSQHLDPVVVGVANTAGGARDLWQYRGGAGNLPFIVTIGHRCASGAGALFALAAVVASEGQPARGRALKLVMCIWLDICL